MQSYKRPIFNILIYLLVLLQVQDFACTYIGVLLYGLTIEANPLIRASMQMFGVFPGLLIPKIIGLYLIYVIYSCVEQLQKSNRVLYWLLFINVFYLYVGYHWVIMLISRLL